MSNPIDLIKANHMMPNGKHGGIGGRNAFNPTPSLYSTYSEYNDSNTLYELPKNYKKNRTITDKVNIFKERYMETSTNRGKVVSYIIEKDENIERDENYPTKLLRVKVVGEIHIGGKYYFELRIIR